MLLENLIIARRFNGPPQSANGGWTAGLLAGHLLRRTALRTGSVEAPAGPPSKVTEPTGAVQTSKPHTGIAVSLRAPPPLDTSLQVIALGDGGVALHDGGQLLAQAQFDDFRLELPDPPSMTAAREASRIGYERAQRRASWPYAKCFGCGVAREDGLCITPSPVKASRDTGLLAAAWTPPAWLAQGDGQISIEAVWAALDCPAGIAWSYQLPDGAPMVTARMALSIDALPKVGQTYMVMGWPVSREGRKLHAGTALVDAQGRVLARSLQLWLVPRETV